MGGEKKKVRYGKRDWKRRWRKDRLRKKILRKRKSKRSVAANL